MRLTRALSITAALMCGFLAAGPVQGQAEDMIGPPSDPIPSKFPKIVVEQTTIDMGKIPDDKMAEAVLRFSNEGEAALTMMPIRCSCGCTAAKLEKTIYQPGESGEVMIRFNPKGRRGPQSKTCTLRSNDPNKPTITIKLTSNVMSLVWAEPKNVMQVNHPRGQGLSKEVMVLSRADEFEIVEVQANNENILTEIGETKKVWAEDEERYHFQTPVTVTLAEETPIGFINGEIRVITEAIEKTDGDEGEEAATEELPDVEATEEDKSDPDTLREVPKDMRDLEENEHLIRIPVVLQIVGDINAMPRHLRLAVLEQGEPVEADFKLVSAARKEFEILEARVEDPTGQELLDVVYEPLEGDEIGYQFRLVGTAPQKTGMLRGRIIIKTSGDEEQEKIVPFYGSVRPKR